MKKIEIPENQLKRLYLEQKLTTYEIAEKFGSCQATIWKRLHEYGIKPRYPWNAINFSNRKLEDLYLKRGLSTWQIEKYFGLSKSTVYRKLREQNIITRSLAGSHLQYSRTDFSGDLIEKAYMIGFSMGDLNVTIRGSKSETVMVKCGTTKQDQIIAFKKTFGHYGRIWESKPTGSKRINTQVGLNLSFSFLLEKKEIADGWIVNNNNYFFSFLAGFSDAEGSFFQSRNQACFSLGNYNLKILKQIKNALSKYGIETPKIYTSYLEGKRNCYGYIWNSNYYLLRCSKKIHLSRLIDQLCRYAKHPGRKRDMKEAMKNIENRNNKIKNG